MIPFTGPAKALTSPERSSLSTPSRASARFAASGPRRRARRLAALAIRARSARRRHPYPSHKQQPPTLTDAEYLMTRLR